MPKRKTVDENIADFRSVHGDRYDYSKFNTKNTKERGIIICHRIGKDGKEHGEFQMSAGDHKAGHICHKCANENRSDKENMSLYDFLIKAQARHGDKYNYSLVEIKGNAYTKVKIICKQCGNTFEQVIHNHLSGCGCPKCARINQSAKRKMMLSEFVENAVKKHGEKYDYSLVKINGNNKTKVKIKCKTCGAVFEQKINNHLNGQGCPNCNSSKLEETVKLQLEENNVEFEKQKKFQWLISNKNWPMSLDFYLPKYNIAIECQGIQHYTPNGFYSENTVNEQKQRDCLKLKLCQEHNILMYYVSYNDNIENKIKHLMTMLTSFKQRKLQI